MAPELLSAGDTVSCNVTMESQPELLVCAAVYVPASVSTLPFQMYGSWLAQIVNEVVLVIAAATVNCMVAIESHPETLASVEV